MSIKNIATNVIYLAVFMGITYVCLIELTDQIIAGKI